MNVDAHMAALDQVDAAAKTLEHAGDYLRGAAADWPDTSSQAEVERCALLATAGDWSLVAARMRADVATRRERAEAERAEVTR